MVTKRVYIYTVIVAQMYFCTIIHKLMWSKFRILCYFCNLAGQKVHPGKSKILFSSNVTRRKRFICRKLGIHATTNLGRYLGFPILHQNRAGVAYNFVVEKFQNKLAGWKTKLLSRAGKLVLAKTVGAPVAEYYMQKKTLFGGSTEEKRRMHMVNWGTVTLPKELDGLGLHSMKDRNLAILAKLCWRLASDQGAPWAQMLAAKYLTPHRLEQRRLVPCSSVWTACKKGGPIYVKGLKCAVRNGESINVWRDFWLPIGKLRNLIEGPLNRIEELILVNQCFVNEGAWISQSISFELLDQVLSVIKATPLSLNQNTKDTLH